MRPSCSPAAQGSGKSRTVAKALAGLKGGNVLVLVPTLKKAEELAAEIERHRPERMFVKVWRGRLARLAARRAARSPRSLRRLQPRSAERMCGRPSG